MPKMGVVKMLIGTYEGKPVHLFTFECNRFYVTRGTIFLAAALYGNRVAVLAPRGMSYRQAAARASTLLKRAKKGQAVVMDV